MGFLVQSFWFFLLVVVIGAQECTNPNGDITIRRQLYLQDSGTLPSGWSRGIDNQSAWTHYLEVLCYPYRGVASPVYAGTYCMRVCAVASATTNDDDVLFVSSGVAPIVAGTAQTLFDTNVSVAAPSYYEVNKITGAPRALPSFPLSKKSNVNAGWLTPVCQSGMVFVAPTDGYGPGNVNQGCIALNILVRSAAFPFAPISSYYIFDMELYSV